MMEKSACDSRNLRAQWRWLEFDEFGLSRGGCRAQHLTFDVCWLLFVSFCLDMAILVLIPLCLERLFPLRRPLDVLQRLGT